MLLLSTWLSERSQVEHQTHLILNEFNTLPKISQKAIPTKEALNPNTNKHDCEHNIFDTTSLGTTIAIKEIIKTGKIKETIKFFRTPNKEKYFGKI